VPPFDGGRYDFRFTFLETTHPLVPLSKFYLDGFIVSHVRSEKLIWPYFQLQHSLLAPSSNEETKLNSPAHSTLSKSIISELKRINDDLAFRNFNDQKRDGQTKTSKFFAPPGGARNPSLTILCVAMEEKGTILAPRKTFYFRI